jgi:hypothetical protein
MYPTVPSTVARVGIELCLGGIVFRRRRGSRAASNSRLPRQTEIQNLDSPLRRDHHIRRFQVAVDNARRMRRRHPVRKLHGDAVQFADRSPQDALAQRLATDQLAGDVEPAVIQAEIVDRQDVGTVQRARRPSLALETGAAAPRLGGFLI